MLNGLWTRGSGQCESQTAFMDTYHISYIPVGLKNLIQSHCDSLCDVRTWYVLYLMHTTVPTADHELLAQGYVQLAALRKV